MGRVGSGRLEPVLMQPAMRLRTADRLGLQLNLRKATPASHGHMDRTSCLSNVIHSGEGSISSVCFGIIEAQSTRLERGGRRDFLSLTNPPRRLGLHLEKAGYTSRLRVHSYWLSTMAS